LEPNNFGWQWMVGETMMLESDHHQYPCEMSCQIDALMKMYLSPSNTTVRLCIIAYTTEDESLGVVREEIYCEQPIGDF
jgi:hypothetical protein